MFSILWMGWDRFKPFFLSIRQKRQTNFQWRGSRSSKITNNYFGLNDSSPITYVFLTNIFFAVNLTVQQSTKTIEDLPKTFRKYLFLALSVHITNYLCFFVSASAKEQSSVADAHKVVADPAFTLMRIRILIRLLLIRESATSGLKILQCSTVSLHGSRMSLLGFMVSLHSIRLLTVLRIQIQRQLLCVSGSGFPN